MVSLPDDLIVFYDHGTYQRVGTGVAGTLQGQLDGQFHIVAIDSCVISFLSDMNKAPIRQDRGSCFLKVRSTLHKMLAERFAGEIRLPAACLLLKKALKPVASELDAYKTNVSHALLSSIIQTVLSVLESHQIKRCSARGLYRRSGISPCPEDVYETIIMLDLRGTFVNRKF